MRVGVVGAGALGSVLGSLLFEAGVDVVLIRRNRDQAHHIQEHGLWLEGVSGERLLRPRIVADPGEAGKVDLALFLVKSYDTVTALDTAAAVLADDGVILTLQNGIGNFESLQSAFPGRVLLGITTIGALALEKGKFRHTGYGQTYLGEPDGTVTPRARSVGSILEKMGSGPAHVSENALGSVWSKLVINAAINAPATLLRIRNGDLTQTDSGRELIHRVVRECLAVVMAKGISLIFEDPEAQVAQVCEATSGNLNSMLQDILAGRRTEIDFINTAVAREAEALGIDATVNRTLGLLVKSLELTAQRRI
ncbi:MAG: 2-dehydropantoate 2-reductase [Deltaproteobacteria bacterium]|nr:2-dehydropantoate 2-reductase [Deltaproteobacteria bacterium]